jgi:hypothetical protein
MTKAAAALQIPASQNQEYGFFGTMRGDAATAWPLAMVAVSKATGQDLEAVRAFLDSTFGRHFADQVRNGRALPAAIRATTAKWMDSTTGFALRSDYGIPRGQVYLTTLVIHAAKAAQNDE